MLQYMQTLHHARAKLDWANKHIENFNRLIATLPSAYTSSIEMNPETGGEFIKYDLVNRDKLFTECALVIGDALHNLRSALDYAWAATIKKIAPAGLDNFSKFPIYESADKLKCALNGRKIGIISPTLYDLIISKIRPYDGGDDSLWCIHRLNILDKHRLLIPIIEYASIGGIEVEDERGDVSSGGTWGTAQKPPYYVDFKRGNHVKNKGHIALSIDFGEDTPLHGMDVSSMFHPFSMVVLNTINLLEFSLD
jgi:hypothetical protein